jgi:putative DNA primase/helicase
MNFRAGRPSDFIKTVCPTEFKGLDKPCPTWERFLNEIFDNNLSLVNFVHRLLGYSITGLTIEHILPVLWGQGRNGKSTLFNTLHHVLGPLAGPIQAEMLLDQGKFRSSSGPASDIMALRGKRIVWASETDEGRKFNMGRVKWLVGGDTLCGREPFGRKEINFQPTHTLFLLTNHKPKADPNDYALWQRIHLIPFELSFIDDPQKQNERKRDPYLSEKLETEAPGILAWLIRGCQAWQHEGLNPPGIVLSATNKYQESEDIIGHFMSDLCVLSGDKQVGAGALYKEYQKWCEGNGHKPISGTRFGEYMGKKFEGEKKMTGKIYYGIGLLSDNYFS